MAKNVYRPDGGGLGGLLASLRGGGLKFEQKPTIGGRVRWYLFTALVIIVLALAAEVFQVVSGTGAYAHALEPPPVAEEAAPACVDDTPQ